MIRWFLQCLRSTTTHTHLMGFNNMARFPYFLHHSPFPIEKRTSSQRKLCNCFTNMTDNTILDTTTHTYAHTHIHTHSCTYVPSNSFKLYLSSIHGCLSESLLDFFAGSFLPNRGIVFLMWFTFTLRKWLCVCIDNRSSPFPGCQNDEFLKFRKSECGNDYTHLPYNK